MIMKPLSHFILFFAVIVLGSSQRSPYAGRRPIGYPIIHTTTSANLGNRFGENEQVTQRLPIDALGDRELVNRLGQYPQDKQPFWLLNWQALEEHRKRQQTYNIRPSIFANNFIPEDMISQNNQDFVLSNKNGQNPQQNPRLNEQVGQNLQQNLKLTKEIGQKLQQNQQSTEQIGQNLQQNPIPKEVINPNLQHNPKPDEPFRQIFQ